MFRAKAKVKITTETEFRQLKRKSGDLHRFIARPKLQIDFGKLQSYHDSSCAGGRL